jgi:Protein of unknown function (DUF4239)
MTAIAIAMLALGFMLAGALVGIVIRRALPEDHLSSDSKDVLKLSMGVVATLAALVLGLLIATAKNSFDARQTEINQITAYAIQLDRMLALYGQEAQAARVNLRQTLGPMVDRIWSEGASKPARTSPFQTTAESERLYQSLNELEPQNDAQRGLRARIVQLATDLAQARLLLFAQIGSSMPAPFLAVLIFWLTVLFAGFCLMARANATALVVLFVCALSVSGAIFLILELDQPFAGLMSIPSEPLRNALVPLSP